MKSESPSAGTGSDEEIDFLDIIGILWRWKYVVVAITACVAVAVLIYAIVSIRLPPERSPLPDQYTARALILVNDSRNSGSLQTAIASSGLSSIAGLAGITSGGGYGQLGVKILSSNTVLDSVAERFGMAERYEVASSVKDRTRRAIRSHATFDFDAETSTVGIQYEDIDPTFAADVVNFFVDLLDQQFSTIGINRNQRQRRLLETKLLEVQAVISALEQELQDFQRKHGTLSPEALATEQITLLAEMRARLINKDIEIETYSEFSREDDPILSRLKAERSQLDSAILSMESRYFGGGVGGNGQDIPALAVEYARLERDIRVQGRIYEVLTQQYELTKLSLEGEEPIFQVLELADIPDLKSGPSRSMLVVVTTAAAFFFSLVVVFVLNAWESIRNDPERLRKLRRK